MKHRAGTVHVFIIALLLAFSGPTMLALAAPTGSVTTEVVAATCFGQEATIADHSGEIFGTPGDDVIIGNDRRNIVYPEGGKDRICTGGGNDLINLANVNDPDLDLRANGGDGDDRIMEFYGSVQQGYAGRSYLVGVEATIPCGPVTAVRPSSAGRGTTRSRARRSPTSCAAAAVVTRSVAGVATTSCTATPDGTRCMERRGSTPSTVAQTSTHVRLVPTGARVRTASRSNPTTFADNRRIPQSIANRALRQVGK
jgi:hypothetical protein